MRFSLRIFAECRCHNRNFFVTNTHLLRVADRDLSKLSLYGFHYKEIKPRYGQKNFVTYKDNDSHLYRIETDDIYDDIKELKHLLDLSDYPSDHPLFDPTTEKIL